MHRELDRLASKLALPIDVREGSERLGATLVARKLVDRIPPTVVAATAVYAASRGSQTAPTLKELANANGSSSTEIGRCYRRIVLELDLKPPVVDAAIYAVRVAGRAHVSDKAANLSSTIARKSIERGLEGRNPVTLAAAAVYTASLMMGESLTQADAAEAAGIGEVSLRECAKEIRRLVGIS